MKVISTQNAPAAIGPYSQALDLGDLVFVSGQIPVDPATGAMPEDVQDQARQSLANLKAILAEAGLTMADVVKTVVFLADLDDLPPSTRCTPRPLPSPSPPAAACRWPASPRAPKWRSSASRCGNKKRRTAKKRLPCKGSWPPSGLRGALPPGGRSIPADGQDRRPGLRILCRKPFVCAAFFRACGHPGRTPARQGAAPLRRLRRHLPLQGRLCRGQRVSDRSKVLQKAPHPAQPDTAQGRFAAGHTCTPLLHSSMNCLATRGLRPPARRAKASPLMYSWVGGHLHPVLLGQLQQDDLVPGLVRPLEGHRQAEPGGQAHQLLAGVGGVQVIALPVAHPLLDQMAAVGGRIHRSVMAAAAHAALQNRFQRGEIVVVGRKAQIVDEQDEFERVVRQRLHHRGDLIKLVLFHLHQPQAVGGVLVGDGLDGAGLAGSRVAVKQHVIGRQPCQQGFGVGDDPGALGLVAGSSERRWGSGQRTGTSRASSTVNTWWRANMPYPRLPTSAQRAA